MSREWMVRWNVMGLLYMIGEESPNAGGALAATYSKIGRAYKQRLGGDLRVSAVCSREIVAITNVCAHYDMLLIVYCY
jgi:hypothetical protein